MSLKVDKLRSLVDADLTIFPSLQQHFFSFNLT